MHVPSVAAWYACGRFAATPYRRCNPSSSNRKIEHNIPSLWASIRRVILVRTSFRDAPMSIIFSASSTASLGRVCAGDGDLESPCRLGNVLTFAINWPSTTRRCPQHHTNRALISRREGAQLEPRTAGCRMRAAKAEWDYRPDAFTCVLDLGIYAVLINSAFQNHRDILRHQVRDSSKCENRFERERVMLALRIDLTHVKLSQPGAVALQNRNRFAHCRIHLASVTNIEAQRGAWQSPEDMSQVRNRLANRLPLVHVFDTKKIPKKSPFCRYVHGIWVDDDRPPTQGNLFQGAYRNRLELSIHEAGRVKGLVRKFPQIQVIQLLYQRNHGQAEANWPDGCGLGSYLRGFA